MRPEYLKKAKISYDFLEQNENEFIVTAPGSYHWGFNCGFNVAEAINFTNSIWTDKLKDIKTVSKKNI